MVREDAGIPGDAAARHDAGIDEVAPRFDTEPPPYEWMVDGNPPPTGLSLWAYRTDGEADKQQLFTVPVPVTVTDDAGTQTSFPMKNVAMRGTSVTLMWHPRWDITHPLVQRGEARELLHAPPTDGADITTLPVLPRNSVSWRPLGDVSLADGVRLGQQDLPPLRHTANEGFESVVLPLEVLPFVGGFTWLGPPARYDMFSA